MIYISVIEGEAVYRGDLDWYAQRLFLPEDPKIEETISPALRTITAVDADRSWTGSTQNIGVIFSEPCSGDATGWSATVNGTAAAVTYVSGSGTQNWVFTLGALIHHADVIRLTYSTASGATVSTTGSVEINGVNAVQMFDQLSKRVRFILRSSTDAVVASESVKVAVMEYDSGTVANSSWMLRSDKATVTTESNGQVDTVYTGTVAVGGSVYAAVIRTVETMIVADTVV